MEENVSELARFILAVARGLFWLAWEFLIHTIGWSIGWTLCRLISLGTFPKVQISELDDTPLSIAIIVEIIGLAFLVCIIYWLTNYINKGVPL